MSTAAKRWTAAVLPRYRPGLVVLGTSEGRSVRGRRLDDADLAANLARAGRMPRSSARSEREKPAPSYDTSFETLPGYDAIRLQRAVGEKLGLSDPYYRVHEARAGASSRL